VWATRTWSRSEPSAWTKASGVWGVGVGCRAGFSGQTQAQTTPSHVSGKYSEVCAGRAHGVGIVDEDVDDVGWACGR
jgi:hypothetical protein